ncbi:MAG: YcaO-like family protein [Nanoarchaeota archaeon]|nr:YcaO-like family protein [Nanoarchaeota archaeon]
MDYEEIITKLAKVHQKIPNMGEIFRTNTLHNYPTYFYLYTDVYTQNSDLYKTKYTASASSLSENRDDAILKVYAEALERYVISIYNIRELLCKTQSEIEKQAKEEENQIIPLKEFINSSQLNQKEILQAKYYWTLCQDKENNNYYLPAQMVYVPFSYDDTYIRFSITTGTALRTSPKSTKYHAVMEVLERHDFMCSFLNQKPYYKLNNQDLEQHSTLNHLLTQLKQDTITNVHVYKINTQEEYHSILVLLESTNKNIHHKPALCIGSSSDINLIEAITGALLEAIKSTIWIEQLLLENPNYDSKIQKEEDVNNVLDRIFFYAQHKHKKILNFILEQQTPYKQLKKHLKVENTNTDEEKFELICKYLDKQKIDYYFVNLTPKEAEEEEIYIYKSIIPQMQPAYLFEHLKYNIGTYIKKKRNKIEPLPFL